MATTVYCVDDFKENIRDYVPTKAEAMVDFHRLVNEGKTVSVWKYKTDRKDFDSLRDMFCRLLNQSGWAREITVIARARFGVIEFQDRERTPKT